MGESFKSVPFRENEVYTTEMAAAILHRSEKTVRSMCKRGIIRAQQDRGGYFITGWAIREYAEGRYVVEDLQKSNLFPQKI